MKLASVIMERRSGTRHGRQIPVLYRIGDGPFQESRTTNFSTVGAFVLCDDPPMWDRDVTLVVPISSVERITIRCEVRWTSRLRRAAGMGLRFRYLPAEDRRRLAEAFALAE